MNKYMTRGAADIHKACMLDGRDRISKTRPRTKYAEIVNDRTTT